MVPIPAPLAGLTVLAPRPPPELAAQCTSHTRRFWLIRQTEQIRASARHRSSNRSPVPPIQPEAILVEDVDVEASSRVDDLEAPPPPRQFVVEFRRLPPHLFELPIAERQALAAPHLVRDVAVDRTVE